MKKRFFPWYFRNTWLALIFLIGIPTVHALIQSDPFWTRAVNVFCLVIICITVLGSWFQFNKNHR